MISTSTRISLSKPRRIVHGDGSATSRYLGTYVEDVDRRILSVEQAKDHQAALGKNGDADEDDGNYVKLAALVSACT